MTKPEEFCAELLEAGAASYAAGAAERLLERSPATAERFGDAAFGKWRQHLARRLRQLAGALLVREPDLFVGDVLWSRASFGARDVPLDDLRHSLECLRTTLAEELPRDTGETALRYVDRSLEALADDAPESSNALDTAESRLTLRFLESALGGDRRAAIRLVLDAVAEGTPISKIYTDVLTAAQRLVGEMWHAGEVSVPQEHVVTATVRDVMALLAERAPRGEAKGRGVLVTVAPGNAHEIAARALADLLEIDGWRSVYLGGNLPVSDLVIALGQFDVDLLCVSLALTGQLRASLASIAAARDAHPSLKVLVGGGVVERAPGVWRALGADAGGTSLAAATVAAARLFEAT